MIECLECDSSNYSPKSLIIKELLHNELTELAKSYQKTSSKTPSTQSTDVLVEQIREQMKNGDTISFAIPYNPAFIGTHKTRDPKDRLDIATRLSIDNIYAFAQRVSEVTNRKVTFTLLYDSALSLGLCKKDILRTNDYLVGVQTLHDYITKKNTTKVQIREWDTLSDSMLGYNQRPEFIEKDKLELAYTRRFENSQKLFTDKGRKLLKEFVNTQVETRKVKANEADIEQTNGWLKSVLHVDSREDAINVATSIELFKKIDTEQNGGRIIRLSPHVKSENEHSKFGFAFFPNSEVLIEPWVGNFVGAADRTFTIDAHKKERSFEKAQELKKQEEEKAQRREESQKKAEEKVQRQKEAQEKAEEKASKKSEARRVIGKNTQQVVLQTKIEDTKQKDGQFYK